MTVFIQCASRPVFINNLTCFVGSFNHRKTWESGIVSFLLGVVYSFKALAKAKKETLLRFQKCITVCMRDVICQQHDIFPVYFKWVGMLTPSAVRFECNLPNTLRIRK